MSQTKAVTRPHCVSYSEKDLSENNWWKVDVDCALCKKAVWVMFNSVQSMLYASLSYKPVTNTLASIDPDHLKTPTLS